MTGPNRQVSEDFWYGKRVLLTGHTGFKGSWLSLWLQSMGVTLRGLALGPPTKPALFDIAQVADNMEHRVVDICDYAAVKAQMKEFQPEIVIHMAAQSIVRVSYAKPIETYATNVMGTVHVLEAARLAGSVKSIVNITSDKCYENREWVWGYREDEPMGGHDPYSNSKGCAELVSSAFRKSFLDTAGISIATARSGNVIGGGDWAVDRLIPDVLRALQDNKTIHIRNPHAIRPWQHVLEPLLGYLLLAENLFKNGKDYAEGWNFGPHDEDARPVKWIVEHICNSWGTKASWKPQKGERLHESRLLKLDTSKARQRLQWQPYWNLETALNSITDWHHAWLDGKNMKEVCLNQINQYRVGK